MQTYKILVINPGSTSTKISMFENENAIIDWSISHDHNEIDQYDTIYDQFHYRLDTIKEFIEAHEIDHILCHIGQFHCGHGLYSSQ
ncbi:MAG TPA: hypothetical protein DCG34_05435 [Clostridiales bacterium]|nr:hypothetical protein [Clostridiales bacterium]